MGSAYLSLTPYFPSQITFFYPYRINMKKLIVFSALAVCLIQSSLAQTGVFNEALLFSRTSFGGTTRMQTLGGAHVSLGGDISSAHVNPAGLGFYNRSEITFTPGFRFMNADSQFNGNPDEERASSRGSFGLYNFGLVFNNTKNNGSKFKGWNFAFSVDRLNDFNEEVSYRGENNNNSLAFALGDNAFNVNNDALFGLEEAAFETFVINPVVLNNGDLVYDPVNLTDIVEVDGNTTLFYSFPVQEETIRRRGSQNQWSFSAGGNYDDKIYFGGGIGIGTINYEQDKVFRENDYFVFGDGVNVFDGNDTALGGLTLREDLRIDGIGINATLGVILRPIDAMTIGISYITPTIYSINEESTFTLSNIINETINTFGGDVIDPGSYEFNGDLVTSRYTLRTPSRLNLGASFFLGKYGFLTSSVEFTDYASAELSSNDFNIDGDNAAIRDSYTSVTNVRLGGEFRLDAFRFRLGYAALNNPFEAGIEPSWRESYSIGAGYKTKDYYIDLGVINSSSESSYSPYVLTDGMQPVINTKLRDTRIAVTVGFTF